MMPYIFLSEKCRDKLAATALVSGFDRRLAESAWSWDVVYVDEEVFDLLMLFMVEYNFTAPEDAVMHLCRLTEVPEK